MFKALLDKNKQNQVLSVTHQLLMAVYGFVLLLILYRVASKEETGRWVVFISSISLFDMLLHGFFQTPVIRKISTEKADSEQINQITSNAFFFSLVIWLALSVVILCSHFLFHRSEMAGDMLWYLPLGLAMILFDIAWWSGNALSDFKAVLIQRIVFCIVSGGMIAVMLYHHKTLGLYDIALSQLLGYIISSYVGIVILRKIKISYRYINKETMLYFLHYGKYTAGSMMMGSILRNADVFMIAFFLGRGAVAVYSAAQKTVEIFEVPLRGIAAHSFTEFCKFSADIPLLIKRYFFITGRLMLLFVGALVLMAFFSQQVIRLLSGSSAYSSAALLLRIFMVYVLFLTSDRMLGVVLEALGLVRYNLVKTMIVALVNIIGDFIALYYFHSLAGVAVVSILAVLAGIMAGSYFVSSQTGMVWSKPNIRTGLVNIFKWNLQ